MPALDLRSFSTIVGNIAAVVQGRARIVLDYSIGSVLRSIAESDAGIVLWLQGEILKVLLATRAATSEKDDLDTWIADYGLTRLGVSNAAGFVQFSRFSTSSPGFVPVDAIVRTEDLSQAFSVSADPTNSDFDAVQNGYVIAATVASVVVPVRALTPGKSANVLAGTVTVIASSIPGIDLVSNSVAFTGGSDAELDTQVRARFVLFIASLSKATVGALEYAIASLQLGLQDTVSENVDPDGTADPGMVTIFVDDGSGNVPPAVVQNCQAAVNLVRAAGIRVGVFAASPKIVTVSLTVTVKLGFISANVAGKVATVISTYINTLGVGVPLFYTFVSHLAYGISGVKEVTSVLVDSDVVDIIPTKAQTIKVSDVAVATS